MNARIPIRIHRRGTTRLAPQTKQNKTFHRRDAEFGVYLYQTDLYSAYFAPPRWAFRKISQAAQNITDSNREFAECGGFLIQKSLLRALCDSAVQSLSPAS